MKKVLKIKSKVKKKVRKENKIRKKKYIDTKLKLTVVINDGKIKIMINQIKDFKKEKKKQKKN